MIKADEESSQSNQNFENVNAHQSSVERVLDFGYLLYEVFSKLPCDGLVEKYGRVYLLWITILKKLTAELKLDARRRICQLLLPKETVKLSYCTLNIF